MNYSPMETAMDARDVLQSRVAVARDWIERWDRQQEGFIPEREAQFTALVDAVEEVAGRPDPLVVDLGCGPGSLAVRLLRRLPRATVLAVDADPLLLELGRAAYPNLSSLRFVDADLRDPGWAHALALPGPVDAVVSTTALHWLDPPALTDLYRAAHRLLRPGGLLLNGDELVLDRQANPTLTRLDRAILHRERDRRRPVAGGEGWHDWWAAIAGATDFAAANAERARRGHDGEHHVDLSPALDSHLAALRSAGFAEIGVVWQRGENRLLCAVAEGRSS